MIDPRLAEITTALDDWCKKREILYDIVCDENDLQGVMLFRKDTNTLSELLNDLSPIIQEHGVYAQIRKVRGGNIIAFSIRAISESIMNRIVTDAGEQTAKLTFAEKIERAFHATPPRPVAVPEVVETPDLFASAKKIAEAQYKHATAGSFRSNQSSRQRQMVGSDTTFGGREHPSSPKANQGKRKKFNKSLHEALQGIATPTGAQPEDLFAKFAKALSVLGGELGIGPLQDRLKEQGIQWKQSDDRQSIILYIMNATTNAPQPVARIASETLDNPSDFEEQLTHMLDFAQGEAPGAFKQKQEQIKNQEKAVRDIAQAVNPKPQQPSEVTQQMNASLAPEQQAAETAAAPKTPLAAKQVAPLKPAQPAPVKPAQPVAKSAPQRPLAQTKGL